MTVGLATGSIVATPGQNIGLSSLFTVTPGSGNPQYLVVSGLDRNEYTASASGSMGTLSGNGHATGFSSIGGDGYGAGIVFTYNAASGQYVNATYGNLANVILTTSADTNRNESISLFASNSPSSLAQYAANPYALEQFTTYVGSVSVVTQPSFGAAPSQATPGSIASTALSFVGRAWNMDGCWVLCSNIAAEAGASLPLTSTSVNTPGVGSGEWIVAYNGPAGQGGDWQSMVKAGEMVSFATSGNSGHITTVVSGAGASAQLVDNITYVNANGSIQNAAHDGSANDVIVASPHAASQEFSQAVAGSVVIYELDTPTVASGAITGLSLGSSTALSNLLSASDPANHAITQYQVYDNGSAGATSGTFVVGGGAQAAHSAASALTVSASSLASTAFQVGGSAGVDTLTVRAYNGTYWGDWGNVTVNVGTMSYAPTPSPAAPAAPAASAPAASSPAALLAPLLTAQTPNQVWHTKRSVYFTLPGATFKDPQGFGLTLSAYQISGRAASWLHFSAYNGTFTGRPTAKAKGTITVAVVATSAIGLSVEETFAITVASHAAKFTQAISAVHSSASASATAAAPPSPAALHALYAPIA